MDIQLPAEFQLFANPVDLAGLTPDQARLTALARARVAALLGLPPSGGHAVRKGGTGPCRICGQLATLTFEHVPPRSAGNTARRRAVDLATSLTVPPGQVPRTGWVQQQKGAGLYATCAACNSFGGTSYVPEYANAVAVTAEALHEAALQLDPDERVPPELRLQALSGFRPGAVIRQALFMLMAVSGSAGLGAHFPVLRRIVLDGQRARLPEDFVIRLSLVISRRVRIQPVVGEIDLVRLRQRALIEVAHLPFAWLAEIGPHSDRPSPDVSAWTEIDSTDEVPVDLHLPVGPLETAIPDDRRTLADIPIDPAG